MLRPARGRGARSGHALCNEFVRKALLASRFTLCDLAGPAF